MCDNKLSVRMIEAKMFDVWRVDCWRFDKFDYEKGQIQWKIRSQKENELI